MSEHWNDEGGWHFRQDDGRIDTCSRRIWRQDQERLRYDDSELFELTKLCAGDVIQCVPGFRYWELGEQRKMNKPNNLCGGQQRAFDFYWCILKGVQRGKLFLGLGSGGVDGPSSFGTDKFCGVQSHPDLGVNGYAHMVVDADQPLPFFDCKFAGVMAQHIFEHLHNSEQALREMVRVVEMGGYVCIVMPDMAFMQRCRTDPTHVHEFSSDGFLEFVEQLQLPCEIIEHNTFDNAFSFNTVLKRIG